MIIGVSFTSLQIDLRILRAVAVEYSEDVDAAVEFILSDVLPIITEPAEASNPYISLDAEQSLNGRCFFM